jgi:hypothetical protein
MRRTQAKAQVLALLLALTAFALAVLAPAASAGMSVDGFVGSPTGPSIDGVGGGLVQPRDIAVVEASGDFYVVQSSPGTRVQRFDADGRFELAWGKDVIRLGAPGDTGAGFEICTVAADCKRAPDTGLGDGEFTRPTGIAVNQVAGHAQEGHVYVRDTDNRRVQEFDADGNFVRAWGWGVATGANAFEICTSGCLQGLDSAGAPNGEMGTTSADAALAIDPANGDVLVADPANRRVQRFDGDGDFVAAFGSAGSGVGQFGSSQPTRVAVGPNGIVYASDSNASNRVQRYDTNGILGPVGFAAPIGGASPLLSGATQGIEIDPSTGNLLVVRDPSSGETLVQELDTTTLAIVDTHATGNGFGVDHPHPGAGASSALGLGVDGTRGKLYLSSVFDRPNATDGVTGYHGVFALDSDGALAPLATAEAPLGVDDDSAMLSGTVAPNGPSYYRFEYSKNGVDWILAADVDLALNNAPFLADRWLGGSSPQQVTASIEGLESNTVYRARIVATKFTGPITAVTVTSGETTLLTDAVPPSATTSPVHSHTDRSAWLAGYVNPKGSVTSYRFEWGKTTAYQHQAPSSDAGAGAAGTEKAVLEEIHGLEPDTTYHYRLVAESAQGVRVGDDRTFRTRPMFGGFAERGFEQVTPVFKYGDASDPSTGTQILGQVNTGHAAMPVSTDGSAAMFRVVDALPDAEHGAASVGALRQEYRAVRHADGWSSAPLVDRPLGKIDGSNPGVRVASPDLSRFVVQAGSPLFEGANGRSLYLRNPMSDSIDQIVGLDAPESDPSAPVYQGASADLSHVLYSMPDGQTYEWVDGLTRPVAIDPSGVPFAASAAVGSSSIRRSAVSSGGEHVFLSTPVSSAQTQIYRRSHGVVTTLASPSQRSAPDPLGPRAKTFQAASADGDRVFFTSSELLTDDANTGPSRAGTDLYRYELSTDTLVDVSAETNDAAGSQVIGVVGASENGDRIYYVGRGQVLADEGTAGAPNLYMWHDNGTPQGATRFLGVLSEPDMGASGVNAKYDLQLSNDSKRARVTADGRTMVFHSTASLTGYRNEGFSEVFVYEADANGGDGQLSCVSCRPNGSPAQGDSALPVSNALLDDELSRALSVDGRRVFFNTADGLAAEDNDGQHDVYEWEAGRLRLLSVGDAAAPSDFVGASEAGDDVFFATRDRLVGQDRDGFLDLYDARVGGGFARQNPVGHVPCADEACKSPASAPPAVGAAGSTAFHGEGDYAAPFDVASVTARQRRVLARRGRVGIRVNVSESGRLVVRALAGKRVVGSGATTARRAGAMTVTLALKRSARRTLTRRGRLRLRLEVRFAGESQTAVLDLRRAK